MFWNKVFLFFLLLIAGTVVRSGAGFAADAVPLHFHQKDNICDAEGSFEVAADGTTAWAVLTDYDQMHEFIGGLKRSHLEEYSGKGRFLVEQEFEGGFLFGTKRVRVSLAVQEIRCRSILFEDVGHKDFEFYKGSWELRSELKGRLTITYALKAQQNFDEPFAGNYMKGSIQDLLDSVRKEILRRQALIPIPTTPP
jgi:carbon monoxide dehydrogenase subunit G